MAIAHCPRGLGDRGGAFFAQLQQGMPHTLTYRFQHRDGTWRWLQQTFSPLAEATHGVVVQGVDEVQSLRERLTLADRQAQILVEAAADSLVAIDEEGRVLYANPAAHALWQEDLTGKLWGVPLSSTEIELVLPGRIRYADMRVAPIVWHHRPAKLITLRDITDRRHVEERLQARIQREQASLQVTQAIRSSLNLPQIFATATQEIGRLLGVDIVHVTQYLPEQERWQHVAEYRGAPQLPSFLDAVIPAAGNPISAQLVQGRNVNIADMATVTDPLHAHLIPLGGAWLVVPLEVEGKLWGGLSCRYYGQAHAWQIDEVDLVKRLADQLAIAIHQAELYDRVQRELANTKAMGRTLREQESLFRGIVENASEIVFMLNPKGEFSYVSPSWRTLLGHDPRDVLGRHFDQFVHPDDLSICTDAFAQLQRQEHTGLKVGPYRVKHRDSSYRWHESSVSSKFDDQAQLLQAVGVARDVEEQRSFAQSLEQARAAAEAASRAKSEFLAVMSHELRTPMNAVLGFAQLLQATSLTPEQEESVTAILDGGQLLLEVINDILDLSRAEADRLPLEAAPFAMGEAIADIVRLLQPQHQHKKLTLSYHIAPNLPEAVVGDITRFKQIVVNLLGNALKFTEAGAVTIRLEGDLLSQDLWEFHLAVQDTGIGIAPDRQVDLFEPFAQGDSSISRRFGGSGLGLAICKRLCEKMQGSISVESTLGEGATFHVRLRLPVAPHPVAPAITSTSPWQSLTFSLRILVAEDNLTNQRLISLVLKRLGAQADMVSDGEAAVLAWQQQPYDLILMDVRMPNVDGLTATREIRRQTGAGGLRPWIVGLSGDALAEAQAAALAAGMDEYLIKPLDIRKLEAVLQRVATHTPPNSNPP
ncbi:MAG: PAS domain S-box protein [Oscillatoriales cyanobacterium SM2_1_8]|nr:PAS domain S-box protein [Oscillatoriales cyanobacterium SM2_1_8]